MKSLLTICFIIGFSTVHRVYGWQCPPTLTISSNQDVLSFKDTYPNCTNLNKLIISGLIDSIHLLSQLDIVSSLRIDNYEGDSLNLSDIFAVSACGISNNKILKYFNFTGNDSIDNSVEISNNQEMDIVSDCKKLNRLVVYNQEHHINFYFSKKTQSIVEFVSAGNLSYFSDTLISVERLAQIIGHNKYNSFADIFEIFDISDLIGLLIFDKDSFSTEGAEKLKRIGNLSLSRIDHLDTKFLLDSRPIINTLKLNNCPKIEDLNDFRELYVYNLILSKMPDLLTLRGIQFRNDSIASVQLKDNPLLSDISSVFDNNLKQASITQIYNDPLRFILFINNPLLDWCSYDLICNAIAETPDLVEISGNKGACEDVDAVATFCISAAADTPPVNTHISIRDGVFYTTNDESIHHYEVYNTAGQLLLSETHLDGKMAPTHTGILIISYTTVQGRRGHVKLVR